MFLSLIGKEKGDKDNKNLSQGFENEPNRVKQRLKIE